MSRDTSHEKNNQHHPDLAAVHDSMLDGLGQLSYYFGFGKVMGQLFGALLLSPVPLSLDDMMERLGISKASVSMNIRTLEHMGMVRQVWQRGQNGRRKYYEAESDFMQIITNILSRREMRDVDRALTVMDDNARRLSNSMPRMNEQDRQQAELYLQRIMQMQAMFRLAQLVIATILARAGDMDVEGISRIEIQ
jgi:HTH-type transcriptional regulator, glycine betaine synthesis regulator